jgi:hypothetical protein
VLEVREPGSRGVDVRVCLVEQRDLDRGDGGHQLAGGRTEVEPEVGGHLVVAGTAGAQLAAQGAQPLDQPALERRVHVLVCRGRQEGPVGHVGGQAVERAQQRGELTVVEQPGPTQHPGVRARAGEVVRREPPVEVDRAGQGGQRLGGTTREAAAPEPHGFRAVAHPSALRSSRFAAILLGSPHRSMKPLASDWSKVSPVSYVASAKS